jgi:hypothetical protein
MLVTIEENVAAEARAAHGEALWHSHPALQPECLRSSTTAIRRN